MTSNTTALASLTATYTDSDADSDDATEREPKSEEMDIENEINSAKNSPISAKMNKKRTNLVSYNMDEKDADDTLILDDGEGSDMVQSESENDNDDENILPPEPAGSCSAELQQRISYLYEKIKNKDFDMSKHIQQLKSFRNPSIYEKLIEYCGINEFGTNYPPNIYDPTKWGKESFYEELAKVQRAEIDKREKEKKEKTKVEIVSGTAKHVAVSTSITGSTTASLKISTISMSSAELEKRRKSKWDQVSSASLNVTTAISGTKTTVIPAFGSLSKKQKL